MKIKSLRMINLGPYKDQAVEFDRSVSLILGENGTGKTTLTRAIELALTGGVQAFAGHRIGLRALIGPAGDEARVEVALELARPEQLILSRRIRPAGLSTAVGDHDVTKSAFDFYSPPMMRNPERAWAAVCHVGGVLDRPADEQKAILLDLVDPALPDESLAGLRWDLAGVPAPTTLDQLESVYDGAYGARKVVKKRLAEVGVSEPERPRVDLAAIAARLQELVERDAVLATQIGEGRGQRQAVERERERAAVVLSRLQTELEGLGSEADAQKAVATAEKTLVTAQKEREERLEQQAEEGRIRLRVLAIMGLEAALAKQGAECETCGTKLTTDARKARADALRVERTKLEMWLKKHSGIQTFLKGSAETELEGAKRRLARIGQRQLEIIEKTRGLDTLDAELAKTTVADPALEAEQAEIRERIRKGHQVTAESTVLNARWDRYDDAQARRKALSDEVDALERMCEVLGPKGIGEQILRKRFDGVMGKLNRVLGRFGLVMEVQTDPWALRFNGRPALLMSASERWRAGFCFQVAVGALTGAKLAVVDGADILVGQNRAVLFDVAGDAVTKGLVDQVILTASAIPGDFALIADPTIRALTQLYVLRAAGQIEVLG